MSYPVEHDQQQRSAHASRQPSASPQHIVEDDSPTPIGTGTVVCGVRSTLPLVPASVSSAADERASPPQRQPSQSRAPSPSAHALLREQRRSPARMEGLPSPLRAGHRPQPTSQGTAVSGHLPDSLTSSPAISEDEVDDDEPKKLLSSDDYPVKPTPENARRPTAVHKTAAAPSPKHGVATETFEPLTTATQHPSPFRQRRSLSTSPMSQVNTEVRSVKVVAMAAERDTRHSIHGGGPALYEEEERPMPVDARHRRSVHMVRRRSTISSRRGSLHTRHEAATQASMSPATVEVKPAGERVMSTERDARRSIHGGGAAFEEEEEAPMQADVQRRSTCLLADAAAGRRRSSSHGGHHAKLEQPAVEPRPVSAARPPVASPLRRVEPSDRRESRHAGIQQEPLYTDKDEKPATLHTVNRCIMEARDKNSVAAGHPPPQQRSTRRSVHAVDEEVQRPMPASTRVVTSAPQHTQAYANDRRQSRHATSAGQPWFAKGEEKPVELRTAGPKTMAATPTTHSSADTHDRRRSVHSAFAEHVQQREAGLRAPPITVMSANDSRRRASRHAISQQPPIFTDADEVETTLKTVGPQSLAVKPASAPPRRSIHGQPLSEEELVAHLVQIEKCESRALSAPAHRDLTMMRIEDVPSSEVTATAAQDARGRRRSRHGQLKEAERLPVAPLKAPAVSQPLYVADVDDERFDSDENGQQQKRPPPPRRRSRHATQRASAQSPIVPGRKHVHSAPLPGARRSLHSLGDDVDMASLHPCISRQSSVPDTAFSACAEDNDKQRVAAEGVVDASGQRAVSVSGRKQQLQERYMRALGGDYSTELPPPLFYDRAVTRQSTSTATVRKNSILSYGSVDVVRRIRDFYEGGDSDEEAEEDEDEDYDAGDLEGDHFVQPKRQDGRRETVEAEESLLHLGRRRRTTLVTAVDLDEVRPSDFAMDETRRAPPQQRNSQVRNGGNAAEEEEEQEEDEEYEMISCYDVSCQTSQYLLQNYLDSLAREEEEAADDTAAGAADTMPDGPHYMSANRWMCALGLCPQCHPGRSSRKLYPGRHDHHGNSADARGDEAMSSGSFAGRTVWPIVTRRSLGYSAPLHLTRPLQYSHRPLAMTTPPPRTTTISSHSHFHPKPATQARLPYLPPPTSQSPGAGRLGSGRAPSHHPRGAGSSSLSARLPSTRSAAAAALHNSSTSSNQRNRKDTRPSSVAAHQSSFGFTPELDSRQRQRQRQLLDLLEKSTQHGGGRSPCGPRLLTNHDMQCGLSMAEFAYRYCDLESERMMVHGAAGVGRVSADFPLEDYNDTLQGAPLVSRLGVNGSLSERSSEVAKEQLFLTATDAHDTTQPAPPRTRLSKRGGNSDGGSSSNRAAANREGRATGVSRPARWW
jgi:hypothetical protein